MNDHVNQFALGNLLKYYLDEKYGVKLPTQLRYLAGHEIKIARSVFEDTIPYNRVHISDGTGKDSRPFTVPILFTFPRRYAINAGSGFYGMSNFKEDKSTLIHELTHVWQGHHDRGAWDYVAKSLYVQGKYGEKAYAYDKSNYKDWDTYNVEQQAQIVEDWYGVASAGQQADAMIRLPDGSLDRRHDDTLDGEDDPRYKYIVENIRGHAYIPMPASHEDIPATYRVTQQDSAVPISDDYLLRLLKTRFSANDVAGYGGRLRELERAFRSMKAQQALPLLKRLELRRPGDAVAIYFHDHLSTAARLSLLGILRGRGGS